MEAVQTNRRAQSNARTAITASAVLVLRGRSHAKPEIKAVWPAGTAAPARLLELALRSVETGKTVRRRIHSRRDKRTATLVAMPLAGLNSGRQAGAIALVLSDDASDAQAAEHAQKLLAQPPGEADPAQRTLSFVMRLNSIATRRARFEPAAREAVAEIAHRLGAARVGLGFIDDGETRIRALSGVDAPSSGALVRDLAAAMDEAIDQASTIVLPSPAGAGARMTLAHARYCAKHGLPNLVTIPLLYEQDERRELVGAISLEFRSNDELRRDTIADAENIAALAGPVLELKRRLDQPIGGRVVEAFAERGRKLFGPRKLAWKVGLGLTVALLALAALVPVTYRVTADARLEGAMQRVLAAPVDGYISKVHVRPGDRVRQAQPLVELDAREFELERRKWAAESARLEKQYGESLAGGQQSDIAIAQAKLTEARARIDLINKQIERLSLSAAFDGIVIDGDLTQSLGAPVRRGETLMRIAPGDAYRVMAEIDERDIADIAIGQHGHLLLVATHGGAAEIEVVRITPIATARDGRNFFEVEAALLSKPTGTRPGLAGVAKIEAGQRSLLWIIAHRAWNWMQLASWRWKV